MIVERPPQARATSPRPARASHARLEGSSPSTDSGALAESVRPSAGVLPSLLPVLRSKEGLLVLGLSLMWYFAGVWYLLVYLETFDPDTLSRLANAFYVLFSREPHAAAIGFVWPPLPGVLMLPLLAAFPWWPEIASHALAAGILTATAGALFATLAFAIMRAARLPRWACWGFIAALWANPMWWYASTNGLSEMPFLLLLLLSSWLLWRWVSGPEQYYVAILANACVCAAAIMIRYEMLPWALAVTAVTFIVSFASRSAGERLTRRSRMHRAQAFTLAFVLPWGFVLLVWIFFNWQIVGNPLYFVTSAYACRSSSGCTTASAEIASLENPLVASAIGSLPGALGFVLQRVAYLNPILLACLPLAALAGLRWRKWHGLGFIAPTLAVLAFDAALLYRGSLSSLLRYYLVSIPATIVLMVWLYRTIALRWRPFVQRAIAVALVGAGWAMAVSSASAMGDPVLGDGTRQAFVHFMSGVPAEGFDAERGLAGYLDALDLAPGSVLIDSANGYGVIVSSRKPAQFVINSDSDFQATLARPRGRVRYVALGVNDNFDILAATYPHLFETGEPFGILEREFSGTPHIGSAGPTVWRLYRVTPGAQTSSSPTEVSPPVSIAVSPPVPTPVSPPVPTAVSERVPTATAAAPGARLAPTLVPSPTSVPSLHGRLLDDDFTQSRSNPGWPSTPGAAWLDSIGYRLAAGPVNRFVAVEAPVVGPVRDAVVSGRFRKIGGPPGGGYGLILWDRGPGPRDGLDQGGNYYVLEAGDLGQIGVWRRDQDHWTDLVSWKDEPAVAQGDAVNELEVRAAAGMLTFKVNGTVVAQSQGDGSDSGGVGVFLGGDLNQALLEHFAVEALD